MREAHDEFCDLTGGIYVTNRAVLFCKKIRPQFILQSGLDGHLFSKVSKY